MFARHYPRAKGETMKSQIIALAALAAIGFSGVAFAGEATTTGPAAMSDAEMDGATAGAMPNSISSMNYNYGGLGAVSSPAPRVLDVPAADLTQAETHENSATLDITVAR